MGKFVGYIIPLNEDGVPVVASESHNEAFRATLERIMILGMLDHTTSMAVQERNDLTDEQFEILRKVTDDAIVKYGASKK